MNIIVAIDDKGGIGKKGKIPWKDPKDMKRFKELTSKPGPNGERPVLIMGRITAESLPQSYSISNRLSPVLPGRDILIVTRLEEDNCFPTLSEAIRAAGLNRPMWICGGKSIYEEALPLVKPENIYVTHIKGDYKCDVTCPFFLQYI